LFIVLLQIGGIVPDMTSLWTSPSVHVFNHVLERGLFIVCYFYSRIIEIAGGREVFCQSRAKVGRKSRQHLNSRDDGDKMSSNSKNGKASAPESHVWELRAR